MTFNIDPVPRAAFPAVLRAARGAPKIDDLRTVWRETKKSVGNVRTCGGGRDCGFSANALSAFSTSIII